MCARRTAGVRLNGRDSSGRPRAKPDLRTTCPGTILSRVCHEKTSAVVHSVNLADMAVWGAVALVVQLLCFSAMRLLRSHVTAALARGEMSEGIALAAGSIVFGLLNAACLS